MRSFVVAIVSFSMVAPAAFFAEGVGPRPSDDVSQKDQQQIQQLEAELLKGEMNSDPAVFEKILADDCLHLPAGPDFTKTKLVEGVRKARAGSSLYRASGTHARLHTG